MSDFLTKDEILAADDLPFEDVTVPEWGNKKVRVIGMNAADAQEYSSRLVSLDNKGRVRKLNLDTVMTTMLIRVLVDDKNRPLFTHQDVEALGRKSAVVMTRLFEVAQRLSAMGEKDQQEIKENLS